VSLQGRVVHFPPNRSIGSLVLYDPGTDISQASERLGQARGDIAVPPGKKLHLFVSAEAIFDLSPLTLLRPDDVQRLILLEDEVFDEDLERIKHLRFLEELWLSGQFTDAGLEHLGKLTGLRVLVLFLGKSHITDAGLVYVNNLSELEALSLSYGAISNAGLVHIATFKKLRHLHLDGTLINGAGLSYLLHELPYLNSLFVNNAEIFDADIAKYIRGLRNLRRLGLEGTHITDNGLKFIRSLTNLQDLNLASCEISDSGLYFLQDMGSMQSLDLSGTPVSEKAVEKLRHELPNCDIKKFR
jgi:Leucine-rich repeat (LRR) protein